MGNSVAFDFFGQMETRWKSFNAKTQRRKEKSRGVSNERFASPRLCAFALIYSTPWVRHICKIEIKNESSSVGAKSRLEFKL